MAMDDFATDEQRVEAMQDWWRRNGMAAIAAVLLALAGILGWQWWQRQQAAEAAQASLQFDTVMAALAAGDGEQVRSRGQALISAHSDSFYATLAALAIAKVAVDANDLPAALSSLDWAATRTQGSPMYPVVALRAARVLIAAKRYDEAAKRLDSVTSAAFTVEREDLRGNLALARGDVEGARAAWVAAVAAGGPSAGLIQMKLDNLPPAQEK